MSSPLEIQVRHLLRCAVHKHLAGSLGWNEEIDKLSPIQRRELERHENDLYDRMKRKPQRGGEWGDP